MDLVGDADTENGNVVDGGGVVKEGAAIMLRDLWTDEDGLATVEYALMLMLLVVCSAAAWASLGSGVRGSAAANAVALPN